MSCLAIQNPLRGCTHQPKGLVDKVKVIIEIIPTPQRNILSIKLLKTYSWDSKSVKEKAS